MSFYPAAVGNFNYEKCVAVAMRIAEEKVFALAALSSRGIGKTTGAERENDWLHRAARNNAAL